MRRLSLLLLSYAAASVGGVLFAVAASYIHFRLDTTEAYTSFCNINSSINCDSVLQSPYARLGGVPVAWLGAVAHAVLAGIALAGRLDAQGRARLFVQATVIGGIGSAAFSMLMAFLSFSVLHTACLMCMGLYAAAGAQFVIALALPAAYSSARPADAPLFPRGALGAGLAAAFAAMAAIGRFGWPATEVGPVTGSSLSELRAVDPEFYEWYLAQPTRDLKGDLAPPGAATPVVITEFSDFECAHCRRNHDFLRDLASRRAGLITVVHRHFPLDPSCNESIDRAIHERACRAAEAAECAGLQGRYGAMAEVLFANQTRLFESNLERLAERAELDLEAFRACMASRQTLAKIVADARAGARLGITSTPTVFFNGRHISGTLADAAKYDLAVLIEARLAASGADSQPPASERPSER
jgi:protein-disulfide isomerase/uncharacterized membrane protein